MSTPSLGPLAMSQTKDDLVKHLNISAETYTLMAVSIHFNQTTPVDPTLPLPHLEAQSIECLLILADILERDRYGLQVAYFRKMPPEEELQRETSL